MKTRFVLFLLIACHWANAEVTLRPMVASDLPQVLAIANASFEEPWPEFLFQFPRGSGQRAILAEQNGKTVGYAVVAGKQLLTIAVAAEARRSGVGSQLLDEVKRQNIEADLTEMYLFVETTDKRMQSFVEKNGLETSGAAVRAQSLLEQIPMLPSYVYKWKTPRSTHLLYDILGMEPNEPQHTVMDHYLKTRKKNANNVFALQATDRAFEVIGNKPIRDAYDKVVAARNQGLPPPRVISPLDPDLYKRLGVSTKASREQIEIAYAHALVQNAGDPGALINLGEAFDVLGDPFRRAHYNTSGEVLSSSTEEDTLAIANLRKLEFPQFLKELSKAIRPESKLQTQTVEAYVDSFAVVSEKWAVEQHPMEEILTVLRDLEALRKTTESAAKHEYDKATTAHQAVFSHALATDIATLRDFFAQTAIAEVKTPEEFSQLVDIFRPLDTMDSVAHELHNYAEAHPALKNLDLFVGFRIPRDCAQGLEDLSHDPHDGDSHKN